MSKLSITRCETCSMLLSLLLLFISPIFVYKTHSLRETQFNPIQQIINDAPEGSKVIIPPDVYIGVLKVNKTITLIGTNVTIDANGFNVGVIISAPNVAFEGFTIQNAVRFGNGSIPEDLSELWISPEMEGAGIYVYFSDGITISNVKISKCYVGIGFTYSERLNHVINSTISHTQWNLMLYKSHVNIFNSMIRDNECEYVCPDGRIGIGGGGISIHHYSQINMAYTTLQNNKWAITISSLAYYSHIDHNNFINNTYQIGLHPDIYTAVGFWDHNYWSDYNGQDLYSGTYQNETGSDGIGDTFYIINLDNFDKYPLMKPNILKSSSSFTIIEGGGARVYRR